MPADDRPRRRARRLSLPRWTWAAVVSGVPWTWFWWRDVGPWTEPVAVALPFVAIVGCAVLLLGAFAFRRFDPLAAALAVAAFGVVVVVAPRLARPADVDGRGVRVATVNVFESNRSAERAARALLSSDADVLIAVEVPLGFPELLAADAARPNEARVDQVIVRSRFPLTVLPTPEGLPDRRVLVARVDSPAGAFILYALHAVNPVSEGSFGANLSIARRLAVAASRHDLPVVLAGDFNASDRTQAYRVLDGAFDDAMRAGGAPGSTFDAGIWRLLFLRIDHVFVGGGWCGADGERFEVPGSDHEGVAATVGPCAVSAP